MSNEWKKITERGSVWGLRFCFWVLAVFGKTLSKVVIVPTVIYFFLTNKDARRASREYLSRVDLMNDGKTNLSSFTGSFKHFLNFADCTADKLLIWINKLKINIQVEGVENLQRSIRAGQGAVVLSSHIGNVEVCRHLGVTEPDIKVNVLMDVEHSQNFFKILAEVSDEVSNIIQISEFNPILAMKLKQKLDEGELLLLAADRVAANSAARHSVVNFLGDKAAFPEGPFILSYLLDCPIYLVFAIREKQAYKISFEELVLPVRSHRNQRSQQISSLIEEYAKRLESMCMKYPLQWYNFYSFWEIPSAKGKQ